MKIVHGTSESALESILEHGLVPPEDRPWSEIRTDWGECPSRDDCVYVTTTYASLFASAASIGDLDRWAFIEVDLSELADHKVLPDEDFMEQATRTYIGREDEAPFEVPPQGLGMEERTAWFKDRLPEYWPWAEKSIEMIGNAAYRGTIGVEDFTRVTLFEATLAPAMAIMAMDSQVSIMNHMICSQRYQAITQWLLGREVDCLAMGSATMNAMLSCPDPGDDFYKFAQREREALERVTSRTDAIEVVVEGDG